MSESMIERVAKAIYDVTSVDDVTLPWEKAKAGQRALHMELAQAAIEAMREPTREMLKPIAFGEWPEDKEIGLAMQRKLGLGVIPPNSEMEQAAGQWSRAIDAALKEHEGEKG
ncbi:hypothetical protein [Rhizobium leguminosarum]